MARQNAEFAIGQGPSKFDLILALFDTDMGVRIVRFRIGSICKIDPTRETNWLEAQIISAKGEMRFEEEVGTHGIMKTPDDAKRAKALMIVIGKMIARYQNSHSGNMDEEIFELFEKAKRVHYADNPNSLAEAIENI